MHLSLLPVAEGLLGEEPCAASVEEEVEHPEEEEDPLEDEVEKGSIDGRVFRLPFGLAGGWHPGGRGEEISKVIAHMNFGGNAHLLLLLVAVRGRNATDTLLAPLLESGTATET